MNTAHYYEPSTDHLVLEAIFTQEELQQIPTANWKAIQAVIKTAEETGKVSEILWAYYYMASVIENIEESGGGQ